MTPTGGRVKFGRYGSVFVDRRCVAPDLDRWDRTRDVQMEVRRRTPEEWWVAAAEIEEASALVNTAGPVGTGVDYFVGAENLDAVFPPDLCAEIEDAAAEEARGVILSEMAAHGRRLAPLVRALSDSSAARP